MFGRNSRGGGHDEEEKADEPMLETKVNPGVDHDEGEKADKPMLEMKVSPGVEQDEGEKADESMLKIKVRPGVEHDEGEKADEPMLKIKVVPGVEHDEGEKADEPMLKIKVVPGVEHDEGEKADEPMLEMKVSPPHEQRYAEQPLGSEDTGSIDGRVLSEYGDPLEYDPSFKGPIHDRSCTDIICCIFFVLCLLGMGVISIIGYAHGDPYKLVYPTDTQGNICGVGSFKDKPNLFFFDLDTCARMGPLVMVRGCPTPQVCVKECPTKNTVYGIADRSELICQYHVDFNESPYKEMTATELVEKNLCASYYVNSKPILGRCVPTIFMDAVTETQLMMDADGGKALERANGEGVTVKEINERTINLLELSRLKGTAELVFNDILNTVHLIAVCLVIAMVLAMIWIFLLCWVTQITVWLNVILFICLFSLATGFIFYNEVKKSIVNEEFRLPEEFQTKLDFALSIAWLICGSVSGFVPLIFLVIIIGLCSRIILATKLIAEASVAVGHMWSVLFWPVIPFILQLMVIAYMISSTVYIASMGQKEFDNGTSDIYSLLNRVPCQPDGNSTINELCALVKYGGDSYKTGMLIFMLFMFFWLMNFVTALEQMTLAGAFASYYWAWDKDRDIPAAPLVSSFLRALRYHTGSLAFGSLIITFAQVIVRYINENAYILIAVHGRNFCSAAKDGFMLIMQNVLRAAILNAICYFFMLVSKLLITAATGVLAYYLFQKKVPVVDEYVPEVHYLLCPVILVVVGTYYLIADSFFNIYSMAVDTVFICFLEDIERNDGSKEKPYYMSRTKNLRRFLKVKRD